MAAKFLAFCVVLATSVSVNAAAFEVRTDVEVCPSGSVLDDYSCKCKQSGAYVDYVDGCGATWKDDWCHTWCKATPSTHKKAKPSGTWKDKRAPKPSDTWQDKREPKPSDTWMDKREPKPSGTWMDKREPRPSGTWNDKREPKPSGTWNKKRKLDQFELDDKDITPLCIGGLNMCPLPEFGYECVSFRHDVRNCGACGNACKEEEGVKGAVCRAGKCEVFLCKPGYKLYNNMCM